MKNRVGKLNRDIEINFGEFPIRGDQSFSPIGIILRFKKGTICTIEEHYDTGSLHGSVEVSFPTYENVLLYKIPDSWIEEI